MRRNSGFTAIEVAVTLAIVAITASFAMPSFLSWLQGYRLRGAAINMMADIEMAKVRAIREGAFVTIQLAENNYQVFVDNGAGGGVAGDWIRNGAEALVQDRRLPSGVRIPMGELDSSEHRLRFSSRGVAPDFAAWRLIPIVNEKGRQDVRVTRLGSVRVQ